MIQELFRLTSELAELGKKTAESVAQLWTCLGCLAFVVLIWLPVLTAYVIWGLK